MLSQKIMFRRLNNQSDRPIKSFFHRLYAASLGRFNDCPLRCSFLTFISASMSASTDEWKHVEHRLVWKNWLPSVLIYMLEHTTRRSYLHSSQTKHQSKRLLHKCLRCFSSLFSSRDGTCNTELTLVTPTVSWKVQEALSKASTAASGTISKIRNRQFLGGKTLTLTKQTI
jgi:hypothetical protein